MLLSSSICSSFFFFTFITVFIFRYPFCSLPEIPEIDIRGTKQNVIHADKQQVYTRSICLGSPNLHRITLPPKQNELNIEQSEEQNREEK